MRPAIAAVVALIFVLAFMGSFPIDSPVVGWVAISGVFLVSWNIAMFFMGEN